MKSVVSIWPGEVSNVKEVEFRNALVEAEGAKIRRGRIQIVKYQLEVLSEGPYNWHIWKVL